MPSPFLRVSGIVPAAGLPTLAPMDIAPALASRPLSGFLAQPYAMWDFGPDATSLASMSSGHQATPSAGAAATYDSISISAANASNSGIDLGIADQQIGTWWLVFQLTGATSDGGAIIGNYADDGIDSAAGWMLARNSLGGGGRIDLFVRGSTGGALSTVWPSSTVAAAGDWLFAAVASDAQGMEAMLGGQLSSAISGQAKGTATFSAVGTANDTVTVAGTVITLVASGATGAQINIGASAAATAANLATYINTNSGTLGVKANVNGAIVTIFAVAGGTGGNSITLAKSSTAITVSGATLTGGGATKTVATRNVALNNLYSVASQYKNIGRFAETGFYPGARLTLTQMQSLYADAKARLAVQGITVR